MAQRDWQNPDARELGVFLNGQELMLSTPRGARVVDDSFVVLLNPVADAVEFRLPPRRFGVEWELELSTADPGAATVTYPGRALVRVVGRSLMLLRRTRP